MSSTLPRSLSLPSPPSLHPQARHGEAQIPAWLIIAVVSVFVLAGITLRFHNLDQRYYWYDEACTSLSISGHSKQEFATFARSNPVMRISDLRKFQSPEGPRRGVITELITKGGQHPPLYYLLARVWSENVGSDVTAMRLLPAILSLLTLPAIYWLSLELLGSHAIAAVSMALIAVSPLELAQAQNAREYSLWGALIACCTASFLRAMRVGTRKAWALYTAFLIISLYTFPFTFFVMVAHSVLVLAIGLKRRRSILVPQGTSGEQILVPRRASLEQMFVSQRTSGEQMFVSQIKAAIIASLAFLPWLAQIIQNHGAAEESLSWINWQISKSALAMIWMNNATLMYCDPGALPHSNWFRLVVCAAIGVAMAIFFRSAPARSKLLIALICGCALLPMIVPDMVWGGCRSIAARYAIPTIICVHIAVAFAVLKRFSRSAKLRFVNVGLLVLVLCCETATCVYHSQLTSHSRFGLPGQDLKAVAATVTASNRPMIVVNADNRAPQLFALSKYLRDDLELTIYPGSSIRQVPIGFENAVVFNTLPWKKLDVAPRYRIQELSPELCSLSSTNTSERAIAR